MHNTKAPSRLRFTVDGRRTTLVVVPQDDGCPECGSHAAQAPYNTDPEYVSDIDGFVTVTPLECYDCGNLYAEADR